MDKFTLETFINKLPQVIDLIFDNLEFQDLMNISTLNSYYHDFIFGSQKIMKKICLIVKTGEELETSRNYQNVKIEKNKLENQLIISFLSSNKACKSIEFAKVCDLKFLEQIKNLEELSLKESSISGDLNLLSLKSLKIYNCNIETSLIIIKGTQNLSKLCLTNIKPTEILLQELSSIKNLQLKEFCLSDFSFYNFNREKTELLNFLRTQEKSLVKLQMDIWVGLPVLQLILTMPQLSHLKIYELSKANYVDWNDLNYPINSSVKTLSLTDCNVTNEVLEFFLKTCPNVKNLSLFEIDEKSKEVLKVYGKNIKSLNLFVQS